MKVDLSMEKNYIIAAFVLSLLGAVMGIWIITFIVAVVLNYLAFKGYEKKLGLSRPKKLYLGSVALGILATLVTVAAIEQLANAPSLHEFALHPLESAGIVITYLILWVIISITVWLNTSAFEELGRYFGIKEFSTYKKITLALVVGLPLWVLMIAVLIGFLIIIGLIVLSIVYFARAVSKLPKTWNKTIGLWTIRIY